MAPASGASRSFPPVADAATRVLILGSLPGQMSLRHAQYYAHPQNQFWRLAGAVIGEELAGLPYEARLGTLVAAGVGLWDVIASAERAGSLDASIRNHQPNTLAAFAAGLARLRAIGFNGRTAAAIGMRQLGTTGIACLPLPSSSPAYTMAFALKRDAWLRLRDYL